MLINKKPILIILSTIIVIGIIVIAFYILKPKQGTPSISNTKTTPEVTISTDRNNYDKGEILNIIVKNGLDKPILYSSNGDRFWDIEYFEDSIWKRFGYEGREGFQLANENIGNTCYIALYERIPPTEIKSQVSVSNQWSQKICPFGTGSSDKPRTVEYLKSGQYRFLFNYGFEISKDDPFRLSEIKTIYSNIFTIN